MRYIRLVLTGLLTLLLLLLLVLWTQENDAPRQTVVDSSTRSNLSQETTDTVNSTPAPSTEVAITATIGSEQSAPDTPSPAVVSITATPFEEQGAALIVSTTRAAAPSETTTPTPAPSTSMPTSLPTTAIVIDPIDRTCPDPSPARPEYYHYYLSGTKWTVPDDSTGDHFWLTKPFEGGGRLLITDWFPYGYDAGGRYLIHNGIDMAEPMGASLLAAADGTVIVAGDDATALYGWRCDWYGHLVVIELDDRWQGQPVYTLYGHVQNISVEVGQRVTRGQSIAEVGVGGAATRPHLHFEVRVGENSFNGTRNPLLWIAPPLDRGLIVGRLVDPEGRPWQGVAITAQGNSDGASDYTSWTYLGDPDLRVSADETYAENFVIGDVAPGGYSIITSIQGVFYNLEIDVESGSTTTVEIVTEPFKTPTPAPLSEG